MRNAEKDEQGEDYLPSKSWQKMVTDTTSQRAGLYFDELTRRITGNLEGDDLIRVTWLSLTLFFTVGGYWLLRSLKDPIMSVIDGVNRI